MLARTRVNADKVNVWVGDVALHLDWAFRRVDRLEEAGLLESVRDGVKQLAHHPYELILIVGRVRVPASKKALAHGDGQHGPKASVTSGLPRPARRKALRARVLVEFLGDRA